MIRVVQQEEKSRASPRKMNNFIRGIDIWIAISSSWSFMYVRLPGELNERRKQGVCGSEWWNECYLWADPHQHGKKPAVHHFLHIASASHCLFVSLVVGSVRHHSFSLSLLLFRGLCSPFSCSHFGKTKINVGSHSLYALASFSSWSLDWFLRGFLPFLPASTFRFFIPSYVNLPACLRACWISLHQLLFMISLFNRRCSIYPFFSFSSVFMFFILISFCSASFTLSVSRACICVFAALTGFSSLSFCFPSVLVLCVATISSSSLGLSFRLADLSLSCFPSVLRLCVVPFSSSFLGLFLSVFWSGERMVCDSWWRWRCSTPCSILLFFSLLFFFFFIFLVIIRSSATSGLYWNFSFVYFSFLLLSVKQLVFLPSLARKIFPKNGQTLKTRFAPFAAKAESITPSCSCAFHLGCALGFDSGNKNSGLGRENNIRDRIYYFRFDFAFRFEQQSFALPPSFCFSFFFLSSSSRVTTAGSHRSPLSNFAHSFCFLFVLWLRRHLGRFEWGGGGVVIRTSLFVLRLSVFLFFPFLSFLLLHCLFFPFSIFLVWFLIWPLLVFCFEQ